MILYEIMRKIEHTPPLAEHEGQTVTSAPVIK